MTEQVADSHNVLRPKPPVPWWRWALWLAVLAPALVVFYVLLTPVWIGIRLTRRLAAMRS